MRGRGTFVVLRIASEVQFYRMQAQAGHASDAIGGVVSSFPMVASDGKMERILGAKAGGAALCGKVEGGPVC